MIAFLLGSFVCTRLSVCVFICKMCVSSFVASFRLLLGSCYAKRIVNIMKVYIERNNTQVELIQYRSPSATLDSG